MAKGDRLMTTALLVCEGPCNGGDVQRYDDAVKRAGDRIAVAEMWLALARRFVHTEHEAITEYGYRCRLCGTTRRYGVGRMPPYRAELVPPAAESAGETP